MALVGSIMLAVLGLVFILGEGTSSSFFQGRFDYNGFGNILGAEVEGILSSICKML